MFAFFGPLGAGEIIVLLIVLGFFGLAAVGAVWLVLWLTRVGPGISQEAANFGERIGNVAAGALDDAERRFAAEECSNCRRKVPVSAQFCPHCGHKQKRETSLGT